MQRQSMEEANRDFQSARVFSGIPKIELFFETATPAPGSDREDVGSLSRPRASNPYKTDSRAFP